MMKILRGIFISAAILIVLVFVVPFLIPIPALKDVKPAEDLADPDSKFITIHGIKIHYKQSGIGEPAVILLHGFASSTFSWREVMQPLSQLGTVIAYDRPGQGLTERPLNGQWQGENPYSLEYQPDLLIALMDQLGIQQATLIGNSAGGTVALLTALKYPQRVKALVFVDAAIYRSGSPIPAWARWLLFTPQASRLGPYLVRSIESRGMQLLNLAWHDSSRIPPQALVGYRKPLQVIDWDKGLWELTRASNALELGSTLKDISQPTLVVAGDDDRIVPTADSIRLSKDIRGSKLILFPGCGHVPHEECPQLFLDAVIPFLKNQK